MAFSQWLRQISVPGCRLRVLPTAANPGSLDTDTFDAGDPLWLPRFDEFALATHDLGAGL